MAATSTVAMLAAQVRAQSELIIIEPPPGFAETIGMDINDWGEVLVQRVRGSASTDPVLQWDAVWENGNWRPLAMPGTIQSACPLNPQFPPQLSNWDAIVGSAINNAGTVAGAFSNCQRFPATWSRTGAITRYRLSSEPSCNVPYARDAMLLEIGDDGSVAGRHYNCGFFRGAGYVTPSGSDILRIPPTTGGFNYFMVDVNAAGTVVGNVGTSAGQERGQLWTSSTQVIDLGANVGVRAINDAGTVLLDIGTWRNGIITPLDPPGTPGDLSLRFPVDINDLGSILSNGAVLIAGERYNLADLGMARAGLEQFEPRRINNRHWIVGTVRVNGCFTCRRAFVLKIAVPCDDIDFNQNGVFPEDQDVVDFFDVLAGGSCPTCNDIDFNNNGVFPEDQDVIDFFNVLAGGTCP
ncbi:hypothetical protein LBMAG48_19370 [Phycisphaerae bacterium]|nr:hypothetical protein LBMAG48_19370 [Phycisphaerae bacterium]